MQPDDAPARLPPRLLILNHFAGLGGAEFDLINSIDALTDWFDVRVAVPGPGPLIDAMRDAGVTVFDQPVGAARISYHRLQHMRGVFQLLRGFTGYTTTLRREYRAWSPQVIVVNSLKSAIYGQALAIVLRRPWVWHIHDRLERGYLSRLAVVLLRALAAVGPRAIIVKAEGSRLLLPRRAQRKTTVVGSPIELERFEAIAAARRPRTEGAVRVAVVGRLTHIKGQHLVVEALAKAAQTHDIELVLIGGDFTPEGNQQQQIAACAERWGVADRVEFTGHVDIVDKLLLDIDMVVSFPIHPEPFGQVIIQAMAAQVPLVAADEGGPAEVIESGINGVLVPARDVTALAAAMCRLADDPALGVRLATAAAHTARAFAPDVITPQLVGVLMRATLGATPGRGHRG